MTTNEQGSQNTKWIWIGLGAAALLCLCAVAVAFFMFYQVGQRVKEGVKTDPEAASQAAHKIVDYELPSGYRERMAMDIMFYSVVMIGPESTRVDLPLIMLAQFGQIGGNQKDMEQQIRRSFEQQSGNRNLNMQVVEVRKMTIRGEEVEVTIYEGGSENGPVMRQLVTAFPGKDGTAMLIVMGPAGSWDEELIDAFIESIH